MNANWRKMRMSTWPQFALFDEQGYTTIGMVVALLLTLSMIFSCAQVYRLNTASAAIQDVADASALAAENQVGQFMVVARTCDALVLSLSLTSIIATGLGVAAACTPVTAGASEALISAGKEIASARNSFSRTASKSLNVLQQALPFLSAASALNVAKKNNDTNTGSNYMALAILAPWEGKDVSIPDASDIENAQNEVDQSIGDLRANAAEAERASQELSALKEQAWRDDCGNSPAYCMRERVESLTDVSGIENPMYDNVDLWSFNVGLERMRTYYWARLNQENIYDYATTEEQADSYLRTLMFQYAVKIYSEAYIYETEDAFEANVPTLPKNTAELSGVSELYDAAIFPVTADGDSQTMHAFSGCPNAAGAIYYGSVSDAVEGDYVECELCRFNKTSLGSVASATTNTESGFEHYSRDFIEVANRYAVVKSENSVYTTRTKEIAQPLLEKLGNLLKTAADYRIDAQPPGRYGVITLVVDLSETNTSDWFANSFVKSSSTLGTRAAVSGATVIEDTANSDEGVIADIAAGLKSGGGGLTGVAAILFECWSGLLSAYAQGQDALSSAIRKAIDAIPFASASGLGTWASKTFDTLVDDAGLQPANLNALKPVTVNTALVAQADAEENKTGFSARYLAIRSNVTDVVGGTELFSKEISDVEEYAADLVSGDRELATIQPLGSSGPSIPITLLLPEAAKDNANGVIARAAEAIRNIMPSTGGVKAWR